MEDSSTTSNGTISNGYTNGKTRLRRIKSTTSVEEAHELEQRIQRKRPDKPIHRPCDSLFSWSSGFNDFGGFVNWGFLLLLLGGSRLFLENVIKYGIRINPYDWWILLVGESPTFMPPSAFLLAYVVVYLLMAVVIEKGLAYGKLSEKIGRCAHVLNLVALLLTPIFAFNSWGTNVFSLIGATSVCFSYCIVFLKLWSYAQVNGWCRTNTPFSSNRIRRRSSQTSLANGANAKGEANGTVHGFSNGHRRTASNVRMKSAPVVEYPNNVTLQDMTYFLLAPTLCYELNFPRSERIRKRFLLRRILELIFGAHLAIALVQQWIIPSVKNSLIPFSNMDVMRTQERLLKLAIPNHLIWLIWFYLIFHCALNISGEILKFADRDFYSDWWNSKDIDTFWRTWNTPVHRWAVRHMYIPILKATGSKFTAGFVVFFTSAFFHEYLVSVPLRTYKAWAFLGMMAQLPLSFFCKLVVGRKGERARWGNVVVWAALILGQPLCIMMYYHDYIITHFGPQFLDSFSVTS